MSIRTKFLIPAVVALLLLGVVTVALASEIFSTLLYQEVRQSHEAQIDAIELETELAANRAVELASVLAGLPAVQAAYERAAEGDLDDEADPMVQEAREELRRELGPVERRYRRDTGDEALRVHFHLPNARSFLRLWRERQTRRDSRWIDVSDDLSSFRHTVVAVNRRGRAIRGVELGRGGFTIRGLVPVEDERGERIGSAEVLAPFGEMLTRSLAQPGQHFALLMDAESRSLTTALADVERFPEVGDQRRRYVLVMSDDRSLALEHIDWGLLDRGRGGIDHRWSAPFFTSAFPVRDARDRLIGVVWLASDQGSVLAAERRFQRNLILTALALAVVLSLVLAAVGRRAFRPLAQTIDSMEEIAGGAGDLSVRLEARGHDEIARLANSFNGFVTRLQRSFTEVRRNTDRILDRVSSLTCDHLETETCAECAARRARAKERDDEVKTIGDVTLQTEDIAEKVDELLSAWRAAEEAAEERRRQLIQADKLASLGTLVAGVAHEINNPNSFIMLNAPTVRQVWDEVVPFLDRQQEGEGELTIGAMPYEQVKAWIPDLLRDIESGSERIKTIVTSLKDYARQEPGTLDEEVDLNKVVQSAVVLTRNRLKKSTQDLRIELEPDLPVVLGNFQRIEQVVINLILNACDALESPEEAILISTSLDTQAPSGVSLSVRDEGEGMSPETIARIKDPFFTTKRTRGGTGLGLSVSQGIVSDLGGALEFESQEGEGTTAVLRLPFDSKGEER